MSVKNSCDQIQTYNLKTMANLWIIKKKFLPVDPHNCHGLNARCLEEVGLRARVTKWVDRPRGIGIDPEGLCHPLLT